MNARRIFAWFAFAVVACSIGPRLQAATFVVAIPGFNFRPTNLLINVADSVKWTNAHSGTIHDTTYGISNTPPAQRLWASPPLDADLGPNTFTFTFSNAGYYPYLCKQHVIDNPVAPQQTGSVTVITGNLPPFTHITSPAANARFTNGPSITNVPLLSIAANAADTNGAVARVDFFVSGRLVATDSAAPYTASVPGTQFTFGTNVLTTVAVDNLGATATSPPVNIIVTNLATTNVVVVQSFAFSPQTITVAAGSSIVWSNLDAFSHTATGNAASLEPLCGASVLLSGTVRCTNRFMTPGVYPYFCSIHSTMMGTVIVMNAASTPIVNLTKPSAGGLFLTNAPIALEATASDANGIASVSYVRAGNMLLGSNTVAPDSASAALPAGAHSLFARALDTLGFGAVTPPVAVSVVTPAMLLLSSPRNDEGLFGVDLATTAGLTYVVQQAPLMSDAPAWNSITTNVATGVVLRVTDPTPILTRTQSYYRAFILP